MFLHTPSEHVVIGDPGATHVVMVAPTPKLSGFTAELGDASAYTQFGEIPVVDIAVAYEPNKPAGLGDTDGNGSNTDGGADGGGSDGSGANGEQSSAAGQSGSGLSNTGSNGLLGGIVPAAALLAAGLAAMLAIRVRRQK